MFLQNYFYKNLPAPLDPDEEVKLLKKYDNESKNTLIERNLRLVVHIVKKFENFDENFVENFDDLFSVGTIGLIKAIHSFDITKNIKLSTYAGKCIKNEILMFFKKNRKRKNDLYLYHIIATNNNEDSLLLEDILTDKNNIDSIEYFELKNDLIKEFNNLNEREKQIIKLRYNNDLSQQKISDKLGISQSYISKLEKNIKRKMIG